MAATPVAATVASALADLPVVAVARGHGRDRLGDRAGPHAARAGHPRHGGRDQADIDAAEQQEFRTMQRVTNIALSVTLVIAGCSLAVAVAVAVAVAGASVGLGLAVAALVLAAGGGADRSLALPGLGHWLAVAGGLGAALLVVLATLPLLTRLTALDSARFQ